MIRLTRGAWALAAALAASAAVAHSIGHRVLEGGATVVAFEYSGAGPVADAAYRVLGPGSTPFQSGRSDGLGRVAFVPDRPGEWRVELRDASGHEAVATLVVGGDRSVPADAPWGRWLLLASLGVNAALGFWLWEARRERPAVETVGAPR